jgi:hypothetical protein
MRFALEHGGESMSNWKTILGTWVVLVIFPALVVAGPPDKTQECEVTSESETIMSDGVVRIGTSVGSWVLVDSEGNSASLWLSGDLLYDTDLIQGSFCGHARMLKQNGPEGARFDFEFDECTDEVCISPPADCGPPPWDNPDWCRYRLVLRDGIYDKKNDEVRYGSGALIDLADYSGDGTYYSGQLEDGKKIVFEFHSEDDDGGGGDPPPVECLPKGVACTNDEECCSLDCKRSFTCR